MNLVNGKRLYVNVLRTVASNVNRRQNGRIENKGGIARRRFRISGERIGLCNPYVIRAEEMKLVLLTRQGIRNKKFPATGRAKRSHGKRAFAPIVEFTYKKNTFRVGCPDHEGDAGMPQKLTANRSQHSLGLALGSFVEGREMLVCGCGQKRIRIEEFAVARRPKTSKEIIEGLSLFGDCALEEASVIDFLQRKSTGGLLVENLDPFRLWQERPNHHRVPLLGRVSAKR
jgi:hypothetical protein